MNLSSHPTRRQTLALLAAIATLPQAAHAQAIDHSHAAWTTLLKKHVVLIDGGKASQQRYAGMAADRATLKAYTDSLSAVSASTFEAFSVARSAAMPA